MREKHRGSRSHRLSSAFLTESHLLRSSRLDVDDVSTYSDSEEVTTAAVTAAPQSRAGDGECRMVVNGHAEASVKAENGDGAAYAAVTRPGGVSPRQNAPAEPPAATGQPAEPQRPGVKRKRRGKSDGAPARPQREDSDVSISW